MDVRLSGLFVYPVKSCRGVAVQNARLDVMGLELDRRFMVVNERGEFHTQRDLPQMATIATEIAGDRLRLRVEHDELELALRPTGDGPLDVTVWKDRVAARHVGASVDAWLTRHLGVSVQLAYIPDDVVRPVDSRYAHGSRTGFADGYPLLLIGQASLDDLNDRLASPLPMTRFRPNLVVTGATPFAEDDWRELRVGGVPMRIVKPCARCVIVDTDPETGARDTEPLRTLATFRRVGKEVMFGQNVVHDALGSLALGDRIEVLA
jgi:uncharacterized protein YcbX